MGLSLSGLASAVAGVATAVGIGGAVYSAASGGPSVDQLFAAALAGDANAEAQLRALKASGNPLVSIPAGQRVGELDARRAAAGVIAPIGAAAGQVAIAAPLYAQQLDPRLTPPWGTYLLIGGALVLVAVVLFKR